MNTSLTLQETVTLLRSLDNVLLLTHVRPDGDTIGSAAALCRGLRAMGKTAYLLHNPEITATYEHYAAPLWAPEGFTPDCAVAVDVAAASLLPDNAAPYRDILRLTIDHHGSQEFFAAATCVDASAAACGEIVYHLLTAVTPLTPEMALALYVAIATDTGCFVYSNTTAQTHRIAAALMETGLSVSEVNKTLFRTKSRTRLAMESRMISAMELYDHDRVAVLSIPLSLRQELSATEADIEELSSLAALVEGSDCGITLRELSPGTVKLSVRTGPRVDACALCRLLGGGGHRAAAGATVRGTMDDARRAVLSAYRQITEA